MKATLWGTRGSIPVAGPGTIRYGGDTSCVAVKCQGGGLIILDGGSGIRALNTDLEQDQRIDRIDILLSHLHMDHVQGLPFFAPMLDTDVAVHVWGPVSTTRKLRDRISRYLSPPLFPIRVRDLENVIFHDVVPGVFELGPIRVTADLVSHPGATLGYRLDENGSVLTYISDHEPALGYNSFPEDPKWTSGFQLAKDADVLIHDAQYNEQEYAQRVGWGHSSVAQLAEFVRMTGPDKIVSFHHDPGHDDWALDDLHAHLDDLLAGCAELVAGTAALSVDV